MSIRGSARNGWLILLSAVAEKNPLKQILTVNITLSADRIGYFAILLTWCVAATRAPEWGWPIATTAIALGLLPAVKAALAQLPPEQTLKIWEMLVERLGQGNVPAQVARYLPRRRASDFGTDPAEPEVPTAPPTEAPPEIEAASAKETQGDEG